MIEKTLTLVNATGLHARPASLFVQTAARFPGTVIKVSAGGREVDGKSIVGMMSLGARQGANITIRAEGPQAAEAVTALARLVEESHFGE